MKTLKGISAASGFAKGEVCLYTSETENKIPHYNINDNQVENEKKRLSEAFSIAQDEMKKMVEIAEQQFDKKAAEIFNTHLLILQDSALIKKSLELIETNKINAEHAVSDVFEGYLKRYEKLEGHFKELTHDIVDTRSRILSAFARESGHFKCDIGDQRPVIVAAQMLTPSMVLNIPREHVLAFVVKEGGFTSHATILARSYGVPIVFGIDVEKELDCGYKVIVNGSVGKVFVDPDSETEKYYSLKIENIKNKRNVCMLESKDEHAKTKAGTNISLKLNISVPEEFSLISGYPHDGVGLLRTEFLFLQNDKPPTEEEQYKIYKQILNSDNKPCSVRVIDLSNDKLPVYLQNVVSENPDMAFRGAMAVDMFKDLYISQIKALLRANENSNLRLLYPMVSDLSDLKTYREILKMAKQELKIEKKSFNDKNIKEGVMIETPAAVMMAGELLNEVDFVNIGSNDLLQYTLAAPRGNALSEKRYHILHPSLAKFLEIIVKQGRQHKKEVCLCGELASFEEFYPLLLEIGLRSFSVSVYKFSDIKCELTHLKETTGRKKLEEFYKISSKEETDKYFMKYL